MFQKHPRHLLAEAVDTLVRAEQVVFDTVEIHGAAPQEPSLTTTVAAGDKIEALHQ